MHNLVVYETLRTEERTCDLGHTHRKVKIMVRLELTIVEKRGVRQVWAEGWAGHSLPHVDGYRAVDQYGEEWTRDWDGAHSDGPGAWKGPNGRTAERGHAHDSPPSYDGFILTAPQPAVVLPWYDPAAEPRFEGCEHSCRDANCAHTNWGGEDRVHMRGPGCPPPKERYDLVCPVCAALPEEVRNA